MKHTKTRAFIAINLPRNIKTELARWIDRAKKGLNGNIKWVNPENFHFTLHFLGYLDDNKLQAVKKILASSIKGEGVIGLEISTFGCFPNESRPRVLFVDSRELGGNRLQNLQKNIGKELETIGIKIDKRPWQMHITFARLRRPAPLPLTKFKNFKKLQFSINSIDLMKSELYRSGPIYTVIKKFLI
ncbi:RNA 2',3'-cyclic phosphodiesterase [Patescibacteria group bacterium AH-259-L07]|nr:RNA 2',3'-cyclic phosphodiesterase [Patescibacteria group bacterium AH-259-L07]